MAVNDSQKRKDSIFWKRWEDAGAIGTVKKVFPKNHEVLKEAVFWLEAARKPTHYSASYPEYVRQYAREADVTLKFLGTNEEELAGLTKAGHIANAKYWLEATRRPTHHSASYPEYVRQYAREAGVTLKFLGTCEEELADLIRAGHIASARYWLGAFRNYKEKSYLDYVRQYAREAGVTLDFLGTNEKELSA